MMSPSRGLSDKENSMYKGMGQDHVKLHSQDIARSMVEASETRQQVWSLNLER